MKSEEVKTKVIRITDDVQARIDELARGFNFPPGTPPNEVIRKVLGMPPRWKGLKKGRGSSL